MTSQKSFGEFVSDRYGPKWVYAARRSERIARQYPNSTVITPKQQRQLKIDYARFWGREHDQPFWLMLCALRDLVDLDKHAGNSYGLRNPTTIELTYQAARYAIEEATKG